MKILFLFFILVLIECVYSLYRKDGIYSLASTSTNLTTQLFGFVKDISIPSFSVLGIIASVNIYIPHFFNIMFTPAVLVLCIVCMDFLYYLFHRLSHRILLLWTFHFVHHSDTTLNLSVGFRSSWFELLGLFAVYSLLLLVGFPLEIVLIAFSITSAYQFLTHTRYIHLPFFLERVFVTPIYHGLHHSQDIRYQNSNFGGVFTIWDKLFSTQEKAHKQATFGIQGYHQNNVIKIHTDPIMYYLKKRFTFPR